MFGTAEVWRTTPRQPVPFKVLCLEQPFIHTMQALFLRAREEGVMLHVEQMIDDEPHQLVGDHPLLPVESFQTNGSRKAAQAALPAHPEISVEIAEREFAQRANRTDDPWWDYRLGGFNANALAWLRAEARHR